MLRTTRFMTLRLESEGEESFSELLMVVMPEDDYEVKQSLCFPEAGSKGFTVQLEVAP